MTALDDVHKFLTRVNLHGSALYLNADGPGVYWTIGAWRLLPGLFWFFEAGGDNTQHEHFLEYDEARLDEPHFLSFYVAGEFIGGVCEMEPDEKEACQWSRYLTWLSTTEGAEAMKNLEAIADIQVKRWEEEHSK